MGHRKKGTQQSAYTKDLKDQMYGRLTEMLAAGKGRSKKVDAPAGVDRDKIYSFSTYESYFKHCKYFADFVQERHPECTTLRAAKKYVVEWLTYRMTHDSEQTGKPLSVWTLDLERQALCKLFQIKPDDPQFVQLPKRRREDIKRSRGPAVRDKHFSERNNWEFVCFCRGTGGRRAALEKLEGRDLFTKTEINKRIARLQVKQAQGKLSPEEEHDLTALLDAATQFADHEYFICWRRDKGGKTRYAPIIGPYRDKIVERMQATPPHDKVWLYVPGNADVHGYRGEYATAIYKMYARPLDKIPYDKFSAGGRDGKGYWYQSGIYHCRGDERGKKLDKAAMIKASKALGHNRISVVADNYIRGL